MSGAFRNLFSHEGLNVREHTPEGVEIAFNGQDEDNAMEIANALNDVHRENHKLRTLLAAFEAERALNKHYLKQTSAALDGNSAEWCNECMRLMNVRDAALQKLEGL